MKVISKLIFGFDIDGVLTNDDDGQSNIWLTSAREYFGKPLIKPSFYLEEAFDLTPEEVDEFFQETLETVFTSVPIRPHSAPTLQKLWDLGATIHLITARSEKHRAVTEAWLREHGIPYHSLEMSPVQATYSKGEACLKLGVEFFVDDQLQNAKDVAGKGIYTLLYHASHNRDSPTSLPRVKDWLEINRHIDFFLQGRARMVP
ncbi:MAG: hypothetical protein GX335_00845 [Firmicutes bacterium]|nr:hypothetical protein [Bacillota bacterium]